MVQKRRLRQPDEAVEGCRAAANATFDRFLGFVLLISLIVATWLVIQKINRAIGPGALFRLFFG
ncbi:MAG: hypothetical protein ACREQR_03830 [Candidatus Binataceae bacterium]